MKNLPKALVAISGVVTIGVIAILTKNLSALWALLLVLAIVEEMD